MDNSQYHICIFTQSHLSRAPRVVKEANVYAKEGFKVTVYATWHDQNLLDSDRLLLDASINYKSGVNLLDWNSIQSRVVRLKRLFGRQLVKYLGIQSGTALGYDYKNYIKLLKQEQADFYIGHQELGMVLAKSLIQNGYKVAFDFEDWHSKDLLPKDRAFRPILLLEQLEAFLLEHASYCYTTSEAMAKAMSDFHNTKVPNVIYNSFLASQRNAMDGLQKDVRHDNLPSVCWFSQVIGEGRGLELLFEALPMVKTPFQLHLRGNISEVYHEKLKEKTPQHIELFIHQLVPPEKLISRIAEYDLGLAFEECQPESRNYTITNKVFHYLQSGIPVLVTETAGQLEIAKKAPLAIHLTKHSPEHIAAALDLILQNEQAMHKMKKASWNAGDDIFAFEIMKDKLLQMVRAELAASNDIL